LGPSRKRPSYLSLQGNRTTSGWTKAWERLGGPGSLFQKKSMQKMGRRGGEPFGGSQRPKHSANRQQARKRGGSREKEKAQEINRVFLNRGERQFDQTVGGSQKKKEPQKLSKNGNEQGGKKTPTRRQVRKNPRMGESTSPRQNSKRKTNG